MKIINIKKLDIKLRFNHAFEEFYVTLVLN